MSYAEAIEFLSSLRQFGAKLGLETTLHLAARAGNPQEHLRFIHVAGTNGKGSTCAMLESIYRKTGLRVGLYTSPHLVAFAERIQVNRQAIGESDLIRHIGHIRSWIDTLPPDSTPTLFEVATVIALCYFAEQRCDLAIWETGLGGRLDATNIVQPLASVITQIGLDHQPWLGATHDQIAAEKAGIIKSHIPLITGASPGQGLEVILTIAQQRDAPAIVVGPEAANEAPLDSLRLPLLGYHQKLNAAVALATVRHLNPLLPVTDQAMTDGLMSVSWAGRAQPVRLDSGQTLLLDGAHNLPGAESLRALVAQEFPGEQPTLILGILADKDWRGIVDLLAPMAKRIVAVPVRSARSLAAEELRSACQAAQADAVVVACAGLADALAFASRDPFVIITGSLYLIGEALELSGLSAVPMADERSLNEWTADTGRRRPA